MLVLENKKYSTLSDVAHETGYKKNTIYQWFRRRGIHVERIGNMILVERSEVEKYKQHRAGL